MDDKLVKGAVKRRLASERVGTAGGVRVDTFGGTVYLTGAVGTAEQKSNPEIAAWNVEGVHQVVNDLVVVRPPDAVSALPNFRMGHPLTKRLPGVVRVDPGRPPRWSGPGVRRRWARRGQHLHRGLA